MIWWNEYKAVIVEMRAAYVMESDHLQDREENGRMTLRWILGETACEAGRRMNLARDRIQWQA
jgi:hypothetical protein